MDGAATESGRRYVARIDGPADSVARSGTGEAVRGGNDGASLDGKRPVAGLLDLLHAGEHRRRGGSADGVGGAAKTWMGNPECFSGGRTERVFDVLGHAAFLPRAWAVRRSAGGKRRERAQEYLYRSRQPALRYVSSDLLRLLHRLLANFYFG